MKGLIEFAGNLYEIDWSQPISIAIPLQNTDKQVNCFSAPPLQFQPVTEGDFIGSTNAGSPVNFFNILLNPHGNGTHTECVGHISKEPYFIKDALQCFHFVSCLITVQPVKTASGDEQITQSSLEYALQFTPILPSALIVRTSPNAQDKCTRDYNGRNPAYFTPEAIQWLKDQDIHHLLVDVPSVDKEEDGGLLEAHKAFWNYPSNPRTKDTITELIFVPDEIEDGLYLLNLQILKITLDVSPSQPVLYTLNKSTKNLDIL